MAGRGDFINLFTQETGGGGRVNARFEYTGHTAKLLNRDEIKPGDVFLCWVTRVSACVAAYEVLSKAYEVEHEDPPTWRRGLFPVRYKVRLLVRVPLTGGVTLRDL